MTLDLRHVTLAVPGAPARLVSDLSLTITPGQVVTLMGPSGIGKSTLLDFIGGHLGTGIIGMGEVWLNGREVSHHPAEARRIGILFQDAMLFPHLSVADNLAFGLSPTIRGRALRRQSVVRALADAGLPGLGDRDPATLSGGQRARIALMRALLADPLAILLDEPFSRLDAALRDDMRAFVFGHIRARNIPALLVTHDPGDAAVAAGPLRQLA
jgi:putative thiamine transport system ATP-binding protein